MAKALMRPPSAHGTPDAGRGASAPRLRVFIEAKNGVSAEEAIRLADKEGVAIASNRQLSEVLVESEAWKAIKSAFPCWAGTMAGYVEPGRSFREGGDQMNLFGESKYAIVYIDGRTNLRYIFPVPREYEEEKDSILVAEHPSFRLIQDGNDRIVSASSIDIVRNFPASNDWYAGDPKYDIPSGNMSTCSDPLARYLRRIQKGVGLVARDFDWDDGDRRSVGLSYAPSGGLGVAIDAAAGGAPKLEDMRHEGDPYRGVWVPKTDGPDETMTPDTGHETQNPPRPGVLRRLALAFGM